MKTSLAFRILKSKKGMLTLDFIFASVLMMAFSAILFAFTMTFTAVEVAQYATFASARAYFAAHKNESSQQQQGTKKFSQLITASDAPLGNLFKNSWFQLGGVQIKDYNQEYSQPPNNDTATFFGARAVLTAKILHLKFPLFGDTFDKDPSANVSSYLMREPTEQECKDFVDQRFQKIQALKAGFAQSMVDSNQYAPMMDDGC